MDYRRFGKTIIARIDRGEEVLTQLKNIALKEEIKLASVRALGATDDFTVGVFKVDEKKYYANHFTGDFEIVSLTGNITTQRGRPYAHLHMAVSDLSARVYGGHLNRAVVSATAEIIIQTIPGEIDRQPDPRIGLNLMHFWPEEK